MAQIKKGVHFIIFARSLLQNVRGGISHLQGWPNKNTRDERYKQTTTVQAEEGQLPRQTIASPPRFVICLRAPTRHRPGQSDGALPRRRIKLRQPGCSSYQSPPPEPGYQLFVLVPLPLNHPGASSSTHTHLWS